MKKRMLVLGLLTLILCVLTVTFASAEAIEGDPDIAFQTELPDETPSEGGTRSRGSGISASGTCGP